LKIISHGTLAWKIIHHYNHKKTYNTNQNNGSAEKFYRVEKKKKKKLMLFSPNPCVPLRLFAWVHDKCRLLSCLPPAFLFYPNPFFLCFPFVSLSFLWVFHLLLWVPFTLFVGSSLPHVGVRWLLWWLAPL
jgi:hypothetical protein